jgi:diketogulonate reductase-like aldo/keto reductase
VLTNPVVNAPIVGVTKQHHLVDAAAALDLELTDDEVTALEEPDRAAPGDLVLTRAPTRARCLPVVPPSPFHTTEESKTDHEFLE